MKKLCYINEIENEITCTCFPSTAEEASDWYSNAYTNSIFSQKELLNSIVNCIGTDNNMISYFVLYDNPNLLTRKKGMKGIFAKYNIDYQSSYEAIIKCDDKFTLVSIAQVSYQNLQAFFLPQVQNIICLNCSVNVEGLATMAKQSLWENVLKRSADAYITFCDVGCDGNSIRLHFKALTSSLADQISKLAINFHYKISRT